MLFPSKTKESRPLFWAFRLVLFSKKQQTKRHIEAYVLKRFNEGFTLLFIKVKNTGLKPRQIYDTHKHLGSLYELIYNLIKMFYLRINQTFSRPSNKQLIIIL